MDDLRLQINNFIFFQEHYSSFIYTQCCQPNSVQFPGVFVREHSDRGGGGGYGGRGETPPGIRNIFEKYVVSLVR